METNEAIVCRCEDVTAETVKKCIDEGCRTIDEIKRITRAGMGPCQGRTCRMLIAQELSRYYHVPMDLVLLPTFRPPAMPVPLDALAEALRNEEDI